MNEERLRVAREAFAREGKGGPLPPGWTKGLAAFIDALREYDAAHPLPARQPDAYGAAIARASDEAHERDKFEGRTPTKRAPTEPWLEDCRKALHDVLMSLAGSYTDAVIRAVITARDKHPIEWSKDEIYAGFYASDG